MPFPTGFLIIPNALAAFAQGSSDSPSFMERLSMAFPGVPGAIAGNQVGNGCLIHLVAIREPVPVEHRKRYSDAEGFDTMVFDQIVAPAIENPQRRADCRARLARGDYLIYKPAPPDEWNPLPAGSSSSSSSSGPSQDSSLRSAVNQAGSQAQVIEVPMELLEDDTNDDEDADDNARQPSKRVQTLHFEGGSTSFRPRKWAQGDLQYRLSVMAFADTGVALIPNTDRQGTDTHWGDIIKDIMEHPIFARFVRQEV